VSSPVPLKPKASLMAAFSADSSIVPLPALAVIGDKANGIAMNKPAKVFNREFLRVLIFIYIDTPFYYLISCFGIIVDFYF
jgi:hypothetical protein